MNKNIKDMLSGVLGVDGADAETFVNAFSKEMNDRVADKIATKHADISSNILKPEKQEED